VYQSIKKLAKYGWIGLFFLILLLISLRQQRFNNFGCEMCADKAGYYMYLPALFGAGWHADDYPPGTDKKYGEGFHQEYEHGNVLKTKFTCGVAIMLLPFFAIAFLLDSLFGLGDGSFYSAHYLLFVNIGAAFYTTLGLFFYSRWLRNYVSPRSALLCAAVTLFGTHLLYYSVDETLMSHLYSFFLFSLMLYSSSMYKKESRFRFFVVFAVALALAILTRPTNALFGVIAFLADVRNWADLKQNIRTFFTARNILTAVLICFFIFLPQMLYWKFALGKYISWSYGDEGFIYWKDPWFKTVWFAPQSGLFLYTPILLLSLIFSAALALKKKPGGLLVLFTFFLVSYLCASWASPYFGLCNFGKRPMVEYLPILMLPMAFSFEKIPGFTTTGRVAMTLIVLALVYYNIALFHSFDTCFFGEPWDWKLFSDFVLRALLFK
jgi:hypothetical protein